MKKVRDKPRSGGRPAAAPDLILARRVLTLANLLKRAATVRYRRLLGLRPGEWGIVAQLGERAPRNLVDLAASMGLDKAQISRGVSSLVKQGLVTRKTNPDNNREVLLALTAQGSAAYAVILKASAAANEILLAGLAPKERRQLGALLGTFTQRARTLLTEEHALGPDGDDDGAGV
jgi:DNA-binding MarR family transcriptional regulator